MFEKKFLIIEDDPMIGLGLVRALKDEGIQADWVTDARSGEEAIESGSYSLILLDLGLPDKSGIEVLASIRLAGNRTPLLIITARDEVDQRVRGLETGADDYLVKPFSLRELLARIRAILRRHEVPEGHVIGNGELSLNMETKEVNYRGKTVAIPTKEFALLVALAERPGTILSRRQIEERVYQWGDEVSSNAVEVLIHYLRKKFDNEIIRNVRGLGWMVIKSV